MHLNVLHDFKLVGNIKNKTSWKEQFYYVMQTVRLNDITVGMSGTLYYTRMFKYIFHWIHHHALLKFGQLTCSLLGPTSLISTWPSPAINT